MELAEKLLVTYNNKSKTQNKQSGKEEEKEENITWTQLPEDILEQIMKRLSISDWLRLRAVCSTLRDTVANAIANKHCHPLPELPQVFLQADKDMRFFSLGTGLEHYPKTQILEQNQVCHGSIEGWLIVSEYVERSSMTISFFNPVTSARVFVPPQLYFPTNSPLKDDKLFLGKMVASSTPDCSDSDCFLAGLFIDFCHIAIYRLFDQSWTMIETDKDSGIYFMDLEIIGSKLYVRTDNSLGSILVYDLRKIEPSEVPSKPKVLVSIPRIWPPPASSIIGNQRIDYGHPIISLAKDEALGELYLIYMFCNSQYETQHVGYLNIVTQFVAPPRIKRVEVYKLDTSEEPNVWQQKERLDDHVAFVSNCKSMVMSRDALNCSEELIRGNSVYFAVSYECPKDPWSGLQLGVIDLTNNISDGSIEYFSVKKTSDDHGAVPYPMWFVPSV